MSWLPSSPTSMSQLDNAETQLHRSQQYGHTTDTATQSTSELPQSSSFVRHRPGRSLSAGVDGPTPSSEATQPSLDIPTHDRGGDSQLNNEWPAALTRRSTANHDLRRRIPLTRQYSSRPHVPGEDSGSDSEAPVTRTRSLRDRELGDEYSLPTMPPTRIPNSATGSHTGNEVPRYRGSHERHRYNVPSSNRSHGSLSEMLQDTRRMLELRQSERDGNTHNTASTLSDRQRRLESLLNRHSLYDWGPEPLTSRSGSVSGPERSQTGSIRRWRPSERLQDYASNNIRHDAIDTDWSASTTQPTSNTERAMPTTERSEHGDIANRVDRALREYSLARRALRAQHGERGLSRPMTTETFGTRNLQNTMDDDEANGSDTTEQDSWGPVNPSELSDAQSRRSRNVERQYGLLRERFRDLDRRHDSNLLDETFDTTSLARRPMIDSASTLEMLRDLERWRMLGPLNRNKFPEAGTKTSEMIKAKSSLQYLARLRDPDMDNIKAWKLASKLGLHNQSLDEENNNLPLSLKDLPSAAFCSWLEPGSTWTGRQVADGETDKKGHASAVQEARTRVLRRAAAEAERLRLAADPHDFLRDALNRQPQDLLERSLLSTHEQAVIAEDFINLAQNSMRVLENAERELSDMLEQSERLLQENQQQLQENSEQLARDAARLRDHDEQIARLTAEHEPPIRPTPTTQPRDQWSVKVTLHEIDWKAMTLSGTMTASGGPNEELPSTSKSSHATMDSFFTGEIVDFARYGLDTVSPDIQHPSSSVRPTQQQRWRTGGPETDLIYWAGIGPFREKVEERILARSRKVPTSDLNCEPGFSSTRYGSSLIKDRTSGTDIDIGAFSLMPEEKTKLQLETMHDLLTDSTWLNENINEKGWILMRWKERCFVAPGSAPNPEPTQPWIPAASNPRSGLRNGSSTSFAGSRYQNDAGSRIYTTNAEERGDVPEVEGERSTTWGLTISGYYYVALHRISGRIEGLYYDSGSAPYQHLRMAPGSPDASKPEQDHAYKHCGVRSSFSLVEFR